MKARPANSACFRERASIRTIVLPLVVLVIGFAAGALVVYRSIKAPSPLPVTESQFTLSENTIAVLSRLTQPVELRLYVLFADDNIPARLREHSARVNELVSELEQSAKGRIVVTRFHNWSRESTQSAASDGVTPLVLPQGDPCYIGIAVAQDNRREALDQLAPEWSAALEYDIARVIARVGSPPSAPRSAETLVQAGKAEQSIKQTIPNPASTSLEDGKQILRDASIKAYQALVGEMNSAVTKAEQGIQQATADAERQAALQKLQQIRTSYAEKLRAIALQSQAEMETWTTLKGQ